MVTAEVKEDLFLSTLCAPSETVSPLIGQVLAEEIIRT